MYGCVHIYSMADTHRIFVGFDRDFPLGSGNDVLVLDGQNTDRDNWKYLNDNRVTTLGGATLQFLN